MTDTILIKIPCHTEYIAIARYTASLLANKMSLDVEDIEDIKIAVSEACNNAIQHSCTDDNLIEIEYTIDKNTFTATIIDSGVGYTESEYTSPNLNELNENGLGIFIMNSLMDSVTIKANEQKGTTVELIKYKK